jgi:hypothetical protein
VLGAEEPHTPPAQPVPRVQPRPAPVPRPQRPAKPSGGRRFARFLGFIVLVLVLAAIIAAVVLALTDAGSKTDVANYLKTNVKDQVDTVMQFIQDHTQ